ncbi:MAG: DNA polymerase III subunit chi [Gammaproteobacteria bacterium]|nr:DNA polymerase III subunit chi [Gammaproteobacteria bacterium]MDH3466032.1 DNA polymerase III subunit chi [Gammaproteobacteria bacterium]
MPPQVDFYLLDTPAANGKLRLACRLADKAFRLGHSVYLQTADTADAERLDALLWTFSQGSFLPHEPLAEFDGDFERCAVVVGAVEPPTAFTDVLISLSMETPEYFPQFERIVEPVGADEPDRAQARQRFRAYRERGVTPSTHHIKAP